MCPSLTDHYIRYVNWLRGISNMNIKAILLSLIIATPVFADLDDYIEFYNHRRFHETLDYKKPMDVYQESIKLNQNKKKAS